LKIIIHSAGISLVKVHCSTSKYLRTQGSNVIDQFWRLADQYPEEIIGWCDKQFEAILDLKDWKSIFHHDLIMASYAIKNIFLGKEIGYIDNLPFININRNVMYGTWQMSSDVGGIKGETAIRFKYLLQDIKDFNLLINSIAKLGQQNGLFCYSAPQLIKINSSPPSNKMATDRLLFLFVSKHYKTVHIFILFWCLWKYEKRLPLLALFNSFFVNSLFEKQVDFSTIKVKSTRTSIFNDSIDVIIPTIGRSKLLIQVLKDLSVQTLLPNKVIIVEQNPDKEGVSELISLNNCNWPFEIKHFFIHQAGVCNARNIALKQVSSDWVFFCDDDNRMGENVLFEAILEIKRLGVDMISASYRQDNEPLVFTKIKQWGTFGAGNSIVARKSLKGLTFSASFEHGYGEDKDFGMQLRNSGCDIIYHPEIEIKHLKASIGGFREKYQLIWEKEKPISKPSPTLMVLAKKHYTQEQIAGFKTFLFLKHYTNQPIKNPIRYIIEMEKGWKNSEKWAEKLIDAETKIGKDFQVIIKSK
jgi:hypothetical protein